MDTQTPLSPRRTTRRADRYKQEVSTPKPVQQAAPPVPSPTPAPAPLLDAPPPVMARPKAPPRSVRKQRPRMPMWLTASIIACMMLILALVAAQNLMQAYIFQQQSAREAAYQRIVDAHPIYYKDIIDRYAAENNLQPAFVAAIILNESSFRPRAESSVGARGLMQMMPDTAEWIAGKLDVDYFHFDFMYDAEQNIRYGTWYLNYLCRLFRGDPVAVACAYHAGQTTVTKWLSDPSKSPDGKTLDLSRLSDGPTKTYAGRVTQAYAIYDALFYHPADAAGAYPGTAE